jgi:Retrotransposon gag protein
MPPTSAPPVATRVPIPQAPPPPGGNPPLAQNQPPMAAAPAPVQPVLPPPGGNPPPAPPPAQAAPMAQAPPRPIGMAPDTFDRNPAKAEPFWNALKNYYTINNVVYADEGRKVAAALTHFKMRTSAGDWASDRLATALGATPINYSTWATFKDKFKEQFIPPQTQVESIQKIHNLPMENREFNEWYQDWSMHARRANVDKQTHMYAFRKNLNQSLHQKIIQMSPQPANMTALVQATRDLDKNWCMFAGPPRSGTCHPTIRVVDDKPTLEINAFQGKPKKQGKLTPEECKHRMDNNLCLYCGKPQHKAQDYRALLNKFPKALIRRINTIPEEDKLIEKLDTEINVLDSNQFTLLASLNSDEMNISLDF